jgi:hypothetical protein
VKACFERDFARVSREIRYLVGDFVPYAVIFFRSSFSWRGDLDARRMCGIEVNHLEVIVEGGHRRFSCDPRWQRGNSRKRCALRHVNSLVVMFRISEEFSIGGGIGDVGLTVKESWEAAIVGQLLEADSAISSKGFCAEWSALAQLEAQRRQFVIPMRQYLDLVCGISAGNRKQANVVSPMEQRFIEGCVRIWHSSIYGRHCVWLCFHPSYEKRLFAPKRHQ